MKKKLVYLLTCLSLPLACLFILLSMLAGASAAPPTAASLPIRLDYGVMETPGLAAPDATVKDVSPPTAVETVTPTPELSTTPNSTSALQQDRVAGEITPVVVTPTPVVTGEQTTFTATVRNTGSSPYYYAVNSQAGWQQTPLALQQGDLFSVSYIAGTWSIDWRNFPYVGPEGYPPEIDNQICCWEGCKTVYSLPYATLLGKIGDGQTFPVRQGGTFIADRDGTLYLRINDNEACHGDNDGSVEVEVSLGAVKPDPKNESAPNRGPSFTVDHLASQAASDDEVFWGGNLSANPSAQELRSKYQKGGVINLTIQIDRYYGETINPNEPSPLKKDEVIGKAVPERVDLTIMAYDVESLSGFGRLLYPDRPRSDDMVYVNGHQVGLLEGRDGGWVEDTFSILTEYLNFPVFDGDTRIDAPNIITIAVDTLAQEWATEVAWARLKVPGVRPVLLVRGINLGKYVIPFLSDKTETWDKWKEWVNTVEGPYPLGYLYSQIRAPNVLIWDETYAALNSDGSDARVPIDGTRSFAVNAEVIRNAIDDVLNKYGVNKVNIVAHSKGGMDTRGAFQLDRNHNVDTFVTLGTPHEGASSIIVNWLVDLGSRDVQMTASELSIEGVAILKTQGLLYIPPDVRVVAVAGTNYNYASTLGIGYVLRWRLGFENDGFVTVESALSDHPINYTLDKNHTRIRTSLDTFSLVAPYLKPVELGGIPRAASVAQVTTPVVQAIGTLESETAEHVQIASILTGSVSSGEIQTRTLALEGDFASVGLDWGYADNMGLILIDPSSQRINPDSPPPNITYTASITDKTISYLIDSLQPGFWTAEITVTNPYTGGEKYWLTSIVSSTILMETSVDKNLYQPGDPILVQAAISDTNIPITGVIVTSTADLATLQLFDDGLHNDGTANDGLYANVFTDTNQSGHYLFRVEASGTSGSTPFTRLAYTQAEVASREAAFLGQYEETVVDENADHLYDTLVITTGVQLTSTGRYQIVGTLTTLTDTVIANATAILSDTAGSYHVPLSFDGALIAQSGLDGSYELSDLYLLNISAGTYVQADYKDKAYTTTAYAASQFQRDLITLGSPITDEGVDTTSNGKYELLRVHVPLSVLNTGVYTVSVNLADSDGNGLTGFTHAYTLTDGVNILPLDFHGPSISLFQTDGPYNVNGFIISRSPTETLEIPRLYTTGVYSYTDFESDTFPPTSAVDPLPTVITGTAFINVSWTGDDPEPSADIFYYDVQYKVGSDGTWTDWLTQTLLNSAQFGPTDPITVTSGETYYFQVRATDYADNQESYPGGDGDAHTTMLGVDLQVDKSVSTQFIQENTADYSISYGNSGPVAANDVVLTDTLPSGLSYVTDTSGITSTVSGNTVVWALGTVPPYANRSFNLTTYVSPTLAEGSLITNTLDISTPDQESDYTNNSAVVSTTVQASTKDMYVSKELDAGNATPGSSLTYEIYYRNYGTGSAADVVVTDTLPVSTTYLSFSGPYTPTVLGNQVIWNLGTVSGEPDDGYYGYLYLTAHISDTTPVGTILTNTVEISTSTTETGTYSNSDTDVRTVIAPSPNLKVWKTGWANLPRGSEATYQIHYQNDSLSPAPMTVLTDVLPEGLSFVSCSGPFTPTVSDNQIVWSLGTVPFWDIPGFDVTLDLTVSVSNTLAVGTMLTNTAIISTPFEVDPVDNVSVHGATVEEPYLDVLVIKWRDSGVPVAGTDLTYAIYYKNEGTIPAPNVILTDTLPEATSFVTSTRWGGEPVVPLAATDEYVTWDFDTMDPGEQDWLKVTVHISDGVPVGTTITNTAEIATSEEETYYDNNLNREILTTVDPDPDLTVRKYFREGAFIPGGEVSYGIYYYNEGGAPVTNVLITDRLPVATTFITSTQWGSPITPITVTDEYVIWDVGTVEPLDYQGEIYVYMRISDTVAAGTILTNTVEIQGEQEESDYANNVSTHVATVEIPSRDLRVYKWLDEGAPVAGQLITYTVYVDNEGNVPASNVVVTDTLPFSTPYVSDYNYYGFTTVITGNTVVWTKDSLSGDSSAWLYLVGYISDTVPIGTVLTNTVQVSTSAEETDYTDNLYIDTLTTIDPRADMLVYKDAFGAALPGGSFIYELVYLNVGGSSAASVIVTDTLPEGTNYVSSEGFTPIVEANQLVWDLGTVPSQWGDWLSFVTVEVSETVAPETVLINVIEVSTTSEESDYTNNMYELPLQVLEPFIKTADILFVPDYGGNSTDWFRPYFTNALDSLGYSYDIWDTGLRGKVYGDTLNLYTDGVVIWAIPYWGYFDDSDVRPDIKAYLDAGGKLFITGQNVAQNLDGTTLLSDYLHASYVQNDTNLYAMSGMVSDPIGDGLTLDISGGDGANNQYDTDEIDPISPAVTVFTYDTAATTALVARPVRREVTRPERKGGKPGAVPTPAPWGKLQEPPEKPADAEPTADLQGIVSSGTGGLRVDTGTYKVVFFSFGFEGVNSAGARALVMERVLAWLRGVLPRPTQLSPADGSAVAPGDVNFTWSSVVGASGYQVQIDTNTAFTSPALISDTVTSTSYTATLTLGTWYWQVRALPDGSWTAVWELRVTEPLIRVTTDLADDWRPAVARTSDGELWVVWDSWRSDNNIWYKTSDDNGATWSADIQLTTDSGSDYDPAIMQAGDGTIWVVWYSWRSGNADIWYKISTDGGATWSPATQLTTDPSSDYSPAIMQASDGTIWVVWYSYRSGNADVWYKTTSDGGATWSSAVQLTMAPEGDYRPAIAQTSDGTIWVLWDSWRTDHPAIWYKTSTDGGASWSPDAEFGTDTNWDYAPTIAQTSDGTIWVARMSWSWDEGKFDIWYRTSSDGGSTWSTDQRFTQFTGDDLYPGLAALPGDQVTLVWSSDRAVNYDIWFGIIGVHGDVNPPPHLDFIQNYPWPNPDSNDTVTIRADVSDETGIASVILKWWVDGTPQADLTMYDDGAHDDYGADDGWYGVQIGPFPVGTEVEYQVEITDVDGNTILAPQYPMQFESLEPFVKAADILFVPDYGGYSTDWFQYYYTNALDELGYNYDIWDTGLRGAPDSATLNLYTGGVVIWAVPYWGYFSDWDVQPTIEAYLDAGGKLFITGQNVAQNLDGTTLLSDYLHASYVQNGTNLYVLNGTTGDPIGDGLTLGISGGDGANNQYDTDEIDPMTPAVTVFTYDTTAAMALAEPVSPEVTQPKQESGEMGTIPIPALWGKPKEPLEQPVKAEPAVGLQGIFSSGTAGLRVDTGTYKVVYFAFGFEAINSAGDRQLVMERMLDWTWSLPGDLDFNCVVNVADIMRVASRWRMTDTDPDWNPRYDLNGDGIITVVDIMLVVKHWGETCLTTVIGVSEVPLDGRWSMIRSRETNEGDLVADALLWQARQLAVGAGVPMPEVAFQNGGGIRNDSIIPPGSITEEHTVNMLPFPNSVTIVQDVTPEDFKALLENAVSRINEAGEAEGSGTGRFAQVAGFRFTYDSRLPAGDRVLEAILDDDTVMISNGVIADTARNVNAATIDFLAQGGDDYDVGFAGHVFTVLDVTYQQALRNYIQDGLGGVISATDYPEGGLGRIANLAT